MPIKIETQPIKLDVEVQKASLTQSDNGKRILNLSKELPKVEIETTAPRVEIDQSQCFAEAGLKKIKAFMNDAVAYGQQKFSEGIARIVDDGNTWAEIQNDYDPMSDQAVQNAYTIFEHEFNYGAIPTSRPSIELVRGTINYNYKPGSVNNNSLPSPVQFNYTPGRVSYNVKQYQSINFRFEKSKLDFLA